MNPEWADKIFGLRAREKMSQAQFAKAVGVSASTVGRWESGKSKGSLLFAELEERLKRQQPTKGCAVVLLDIDMLRSAAKGGLSCKQLLSLFQ